MAVEKKLMKTYQTNGKNRVAQSKKGMSRNNSILANLAFFAQFELVKCSPAQKMLKATRPKECRQFQIALPSRRKGEFRSWKPYWKLVFGPTTLEHAK